MATSIRPNYDVVVVGARAAGASTAMLLARRGLRVLAVDRDGYGSDTLSTHALMRGAVDHLERWGVAAGLRARVPAILTTTFHYGDNAFELDIVGDGKSPLMAPRRTVLDRALVDAAVEAGAEIRHRTRLVGLDTDPTGRVIGARLADQAGTETSVRAGLVVGADGLRSTVARRVGAPVTRQGTEASAYVMRYFDDMPLPDSGYHWLYRPGIGAGFIPTGDGQFVVFAGMTRDRFRDEIRHDPTAGFHRVLDEIAPDFGRAARSATPAGPVRSWPGQPGRFLRPQGPGWALVGDAGYFKDPYAAHGISDALRDAELLADAVVDGDLTRYERDRDRLSLPLFEALEEIASYRWTLDDLPALHLRLGKAMSAEQAELGRIRAGSRSGDPVEVLAGLAA